MARGPLHLRPVGANAGPAVGPAPRQRRQLAGADGTNPVGVLRTGAARWGVVRREPPIGCTRVRGRGAGAAAANLSDRRPNADEIKNLKYILQIFRLRKSPWLFGLTGDGDFVIARIIQISNNRTGYSFQTRFRSVRSNIL